MFLAFNEPDHSRWVTELLGAAPTQFRCFHLLPMNLFTPGIFHSCIFLASCNCLCNEGKTCKNGKNWGKPCTMTETDRQRQGRGFVLVYISYSPCRLNSVCLFQHEKRTTLSMTVIPPYRYRFYCFFHHLFILLQVTQLPRAEQQGQLLGSFDEKAYLTGKLLRPGDDPYRDHAFNVQESDRLGSERAIRDTRHYR